MALILLFLGVGYLTVSEDEKNPANKARGPVKDPRGAITIESGVAISFLATDPPQSAPKSQRKRNGLNKRV